MLSGCCRRASLRKMLNLAEVWGLRPDGTNPCRHVPKLPACRTSARSVNALMTASYWEIGRSETLSRKSGDGLLIENSQTVSRKFDLSELAQAFTLPWSAYVRLLSVKDVQTRQLYETEALRGGWSVRQAIEHKMQRGASFTSPAAVKDCPQQSGMAERVARTLKEQGAHRHRFESLPHASRAMGDWTGFYKHRPPAPGAEDENPG
ncbi:hypothetical protein BN940_01746 [Castellaniella defragrans 65Phen]|uniref:YhcG N-terminal domain-containing protein n=2 Tax=Castellaniella defragrans TaxID=75697 RepID=W8X1Q1_CASD6|nr:hypothetical protein BN940_01746 [Castellaniella defragrans 65Phen]